MIKIFENFQLSWDIEELEKEFIQNQMHPTNSNLNYSCPSGKPHWQYFPSANIYFSRNFCINFTKECNEVNEKLANMKERLLDVEIQDEEFRLALQNFNFLEARLVISKIMPNENVKVHVDKTRKIALNIGLKNSNKWRTLVSDSPNVSEFENSNKQCATLNDGDGYLFRAENSHSVESIEFTNKPRYIISYSL